MFPLDKWGFLLTSQVSKKFADEIAQNPVWSKILGLEPIIGHSFTVGTCGICTVSFVFSHQMFGMCSQKRFLHMSLLDK